jgi:hypothetical protein
MNKKLMFFICFLCFQCILFSQNKPHFIKGSIKDSLGVVANANVLNLQTTEGTFSSDKGNFELFAFLGDSIQISSVPHKTKIIVISKTDIENKNIEITLQIKVTQLDEFELKQNNLSGSLTSDLKKVPVKIRDSILEKNMNYIKNAKNGKLIPDIIDTRVMPPMNDVDPISGNAARPSGGKGIASRGLKKERTKKAHFNYIRAFPKKILTDLGEDFFFVQLKIPKERYYHFLEYCNPLGIEKKYKNGEILEVIEILKNESSSYLKITTSK